MKCKPTKNYYQSRYRDGTPVTPPTTSAPYPYKMPFNRKYTSYDQHGPAPTFYPSSLMPRSHYNMTHNPPPSRREADSWACDYCQVAIFGTYQLACEHENSCSMNQNVLTTNKTVEVKPKKCNISSQSNAPQILLCMPTDRQSLSDRQCYVRSHFVEIFEATSMDVSARHSKGAQKLRIGQIGIRCMHCTQFDIKNRAERAICYPSSISRIYQTVADMQRFHFESCTGIIESMKVVYRSVKTTRPRGQGSPQSYWISSAKDLGLVDTSEGIRLSKGTIKMALTPISPLSNQERLKTTSPSSPGSQSACVSHNSANREELSDNINCDEEANMLLALRSG